MVQGKRDKPPRHALVLSPDGIDAQKGFKVSRLDESKPESDVSLTFTPPCYSRCAPLDPAPKP